MITIDRIRIALGIVFLSASIMRIVLPELARIEMEQLGFAHQFSYLIIAFEIAAGGALLLGIRVRLVIMLLLVFLLAAIGIGIGVGLEQGPFELRRLFIFDPALTDVALHALYVVALFWLLRKLPGERMS